MQRVSTAAPDVLAPVSIPVDREAQIDAGEELRIAEGPGQLPLSTERETP